MAGRLTLLAWMTIVVAAAGIGSSACSSDSGTTTAPDPNARVGDIRQADTWKNGTKLTGIVRIFEGATVTIEPGARITCAESVLIQVGGKINVKAGGNHATITCARWRGIQVVSAGSLDIEGLDIENADTGVETTKGAGSVSLADSNILGSTRPFLVGKESKLSLTKVKATTPKAVTTTFDQSVAEIFGSLVAKHLDYEANGNEGLMVKEGGELDIEDSTLKADNGLDLISTYGGKSVKMRYTTMTGAHCGPHIQGVGTLEIDHVTSEGNKYGITIYDASLTGPHTIKDSNFQGAAAWLDLKGDHGALEFTNVFVEGPELIGNTTPPSTLVKATAKVQGAGPRP